MGIKDQKEFKAEAAAPQFEAQPATETTTATQENTINTTTEQTASAGAKAATAIAAASASSALAVATPKPKFTVAFADKNNVFDTATVEGLALAAPRIKGEQGSIFMADVDVGTKIQFELISFNHRWAVSSGENDAEAKEYFRVSFDNKTLSGSGASLADYVEGLKAQGFSKAKVSPYMDIWGFVVWTEKGGEVPVEERQLSCIQASQTSLGAFTAFATTRGLLESRGLVQPLEVIEMHAEKRISGTNKYTNFSFHAPAAVAAK